MSKIRNLLKKFKKKKSDEDSTGEHNISQHDISQFDQEDIDIELFDENEHIPLMATEDETGDIEVEGQLYEDRTATGTLDLENGTIPLKDRANDALESFKASMQRFKINRPKKMSLKKNDETQDSSSKINLTPSLKDAEGKFKERLQKINWKGLHNEFFLNKHRDTYHRTFQIASVVLITFALGKTTGLLLKGKVSYKNMKKNAFIDIDESQALTSAKLTELKNDNLFKTQALKSSPGTKTPTVKTNIACKNASKKSNLPITLINTIVMQDSVKSIASVQLRSSNELLELRQNENINSMAKVDRIERLRLIVKNLQDGSCEYIENEKAEKVRSTIAVLNPKQSVSFKKQQKKMKGIENEGNSFVIDKSLIQEKMTNIQDILTEARGIQITNPDGSLSFKIVDIKPGGVFSYLGINNNDIITQINGQPITDLNMVMGLFGKITNINKLNLTIRRNGTETPLDYKFR